MGVYSVMLPDENLIRAVDGLNRIVILGCGGCANDSLAYDKNITLKVIFDKHLGQNGPAPDAIIEEANRLMDLFGNKVKDIRIAVGMGLCTRSTDAKPDEWVSTCSEAEAVVALCCVGGMVGIKEYLGKAIKVIPGMKTIGVHYSYKVIDPDTGLLNIDRDKSAFMAIFNRKQSDL
jgi:hypothetical protein